MHHTTFFVHAGSKLCISCRGWSQFPFPNLNFHLRSEYNILKTDLQVTKQGLVIPKDSASVLKLDDYFLCQIPPVLQTGPQHPR